MAQQAQITVTGRVAKQWMDNGEVTRLAIATPQGDKWIAYSKNPKFPQPVPNEGDQITAVCNAWPADSPDPRLYIYNLKIMGQAQQSQNGHAAPASPTPSVVRGPEISAVQSARHAALRAAATYEGAMSIESMLEQAEKIERWILDSKSHLTFEFKTMRSTEVAESEILPSVDDDPEDLPEELPETETF